MQKGGVTCDAALMNAYSKDLRMRVLAAVDRGTLRKEIVRVFGVSLATVAAAG